MAIIIQDNSITLNEGVKLYRDALVSDGTLFLMDLSNKGGTDDFNIANGNPVYNLARDTGLVPYDAVMNTRKTMKLSEGRGFSSSSSDEDGYMNAQHELSGIVLPDELGAYLASTSNRTLHIFWMRREYPSISNQNSLMRSALNRELGFNYSISCGDTKSYVIRVGGAQITTTPRADNELVQVAVEYIDNTTAPNLYINGVLSSTLNRNPSTTGGFQLQSSAIGNSDSVLPTSNFMYRMIVEDLTISGRTAQEVVTKDFNYVHQTGEYLNLPTKRPFVDKL